MKITALLLPLVAFLPVISASYQPPEEEAAVKAFMRKYSKYFYGGPNSVANVPKLKVAAKKPAPPVDQCAYWYENIKHQGVAAFNSNASYVVYRNVKDYGAMGDGVTDDTAAINRAISEGGRFNMASGQTTTNTLGVIYFPAGTYLITQSIQIYYFTVIIGNPNCMPTILGAPNYQVNAIGYSPGMLEGDLNYAVGSTNIFYRQVRNLIIDATQIPANVGVAGIHWNTAQATSLQNVVIKMSDAADTTHIGFLAQDGSAGWLSDVIVTGGQYGMMFGNQQWTMRNISVSNSPYCMLLGYAWGMTFSGLNLNNCSKAGLDMTAGGYANPASQSINSVTIIDSYFANMPLVAVNTAWTPNANPPAAGGLILENIEIYNVSNTVYGLNGQTLLAGSPGTETISAYAQGHSYPVNGNGPVTDGYGLIDDVPRPSSLLNANGAYYTQTKPQFADRPASDFISARANGAKGDGVADDTGALQRTINKATNNGKIAFIDAGTYRVTRTLNIPPATILIGEGYSVIMSSGSFFNNVNKPQPVLKVGTAGQLGRVRMTDLIVATSNGNGKGQIGAILIEWNLAAPAGSPSGMWDVHTRIGGFIGSNFEGSTCPKTPAVSKNNANELGNACYAAFMSLYISPAAEGLYLENNWFWTADHDIDSNQGGNQITIYTGRGMLVESQNGPVWLWGTSVEHHALYQYSFINTQDVFMGQIQTETAYWQPNPNASVPFKANPLYSDPVFPTTRSNNSAGANVPNADGWGARAVNSTLYMYGVGLYSFFNNYTTDCSNAGNDTCQSRIFEITNSDVYLYDLHTVGAQRMVTLDGKDIIPFDENLADYTDNVHVFRTTASSDTTAENVRADVVF